MSLEDFDALLPNENLFKQPDAVSQFPFPSLDIPEFSHFPIENGNFGDLEFLDLASDRLLNKNKNAGQFSDIYFNSLATPSGYCSANFLTEEANRLSLLLSESGEKEKGEVLDKSLIENLEDIFGVGTQATKQNCTIDEQLPNVMGPLEQKSGYDVEFEVPNDVLNIMAKNFENFEELNQAECGPEVDESNINKTITIKSVRPHLSTEPPRGAVAKIILNSSKRLDSTKITFSSMDDTEQHSFNLNTSNMRKAAECLRRYNLDNMECLRKLLRFGPRRVKKPEGSEARKSASSLHPLLGEAHAPRSAPVSYPPVVDDSRSVVIPQRNVVSSHTDHDVLLNPGAEVTALRKILPAENGSFVSVAEDPGGGSSQSVNSCASNPVANVPFTEISNIREGEVSSSKNTIAISKCAAAAKQLETELASKGINVEISIVEVEDQIYFCCPWEDCKKAFTTAYELKLHIMIHYNFKPFQCDHPGCTWSFVTAFKLNRHKRTHTKAKDFPCTYNDCQKKFTTMYNLTVHLRAHGRPLKFSCDFCTERFLTFKLLNEHIARCHPGDQKPGFSCDFPGCDRSFFASSHLVSHKRFHTTDLVCKFENCGKQFSKSSHLRSHEISHSDDRGFACDYMNCEARFKTSSKLMRHKKIHDKTDTLTCDICQKKICRREHFRSHYLTHSHEKTLQCVADFCEKKFAGKELLYNHIRKVHGKGKGKSSSLLCPISECSERFVSREAFETHLSGHGRDIQENLMADSQDSTQLDFVALLSSVGEDILLPDELACPEYEISSDLAEKNRMGSELATGQEEDSHQFPLFSSSECVDNGVAKLVLPDAEGGGEILISIQPQTVQDQKSVVHTLRLPNHSSGGVDRVLHNSTTNMEDASISQTVVSEFHPCEEVGMLISGVAVNSNSVDDVTLGQTLKIPFSMANQIESLSRLEESSGSVETDVIQHTLDDLVDGVTYTCMDAVDQSSGLGITLSKVGEEMCLVESKHSTINLQDLK